MNGSINSIESCGAVDGPGIRCVVFLNKCLLRCKFCHNPETWNMQGMNYTSDELVKKVVRFKPYFKRNNGGITFSGGEPLCQRDFLYETILKLKQEGIHIALDTAGYTNEEYIDILKEVDLLLYDIKDITEEGYKSLTGGNINKTKKFLADAKELNKKFWIRLVVVPGIHDSNEYMDNLIDYIIENFDTNNVERIEFLPYHKLGSEKYITLNIPNPYEYLEEMDKDKCDELYNYFIEKYKNKTNK